MSEDLCHYCQHPSETGHYVTFYTNDGSENVEFLCPTCYSEWLESIKG